MERYAPNPHYLALRGQPTLLIGAGEHYGALINLDFDYLTYFDALARYGLNQTRIFSGTYREVLGAFGIAENMLMPAAGRFLAPWIEEQGRYDLEQLNPAYFARLDAILRAADEHDIVVELVLFCCWYSAELWAASPMHPDHTRQAVGPRDHTRVYTLDDNALLPYQEALVRALVAAANPYENVYFELINEPYARNDHTDDDAWQRHIAACIVAAEANLPHTHLIARNYQNHTARIVEPDPNIAICNFHYALPEAVTVNYHLQCVIADDETGFVGQIAAPYRREAWRFALAGGGIISHLDYGFTCAHPDGSAPNIGATPGYGGDDLRQQLAFLRRFLESIEVWRLQPYQQLLSWHRADVPPQVLADPGRLYVLYFADNTAPTTYELKLPPGLYELAWIGPVALRVLHQERVTHERGLLRVQTPRHADDLVLRVTRLADAPSGE